MFDKHFNQSIGLNRTAAAQFSSSSSEAQSANFSVDDNTEIEIEKTKTLLYTTIRAILNAKINTEIAVLPTGMRGLCIL
jgi:hypothetical protein